MGDEPEFDGDAAIAEAILAAYPSAEIVVCDGSPAKKFQLAGAFATRFETPVPHWLIVSRGFTELEAKEEVNPEVSGWGFELTCRVPARNAKPDFGWVIAWMQGIADQLATGGSTLEPFHSIVVIPPGSQDAMCAVVVTRDVALQPSRSSNGAFSFLQMVGLTPPELDVMRQWNSRGMVGLIQARDPLLLMDAKRTNYLRDPEFAAEVAVGRARDGSSTGFFSGVPVLWIETDEGVNVHMAVDAVSSFKFALQHRLAHERPLFMMGDKRRREGRDGKVMESTNINVALIPEEGPSGIETEDGVKACVLRLMPDAVKQLTETLTEKPGAYEIPSLKGIRFIVAAPERFEDPRYPW